MSTDYPHPHLYLEHNKFTFYLDHNKVLFYLDHNKFLGQAQRRRGGRGLRSGTATAPGQGTYYGTIIMVKATCELTMVNIKQELIMVTGMQINLLWA